MMQEKEREKQGNLKPVQGNLGDKRELIHKPVKAMRLVIK
jgi:hypothetical protein